MKIKDLFVNYKKIASLSLALGLAFAHAPSTVKAETIVINQEIVQEEVTDTEYDFESSLQSFGAYSQKDETWGNRSYRSTTISSGGCGPLSITNGLSLAFNINSAERASSILGDAINSGSNYRNINNALLNGDSRYPAINSIRNSIDGTVLNGGESASSISNCVRNHFDNNTYIFGVMNFDNQGIENVIRMVRHIYTINPDTNIIFYNMTGGMLQYQRPFGSVSNSGHYVTLVINVREFVENNCVYLLDSLPKNLFGETNHRANYPFVEKPRYGRLREFNEFFTVTRVSEDIIKITCNEELCKDNMMLLGLDGGCGVIICPNNLTKIEELNSEKENTRTR